MVDVITTKGQLDGTNFLHRHCWLDRLGSRGFCVRVDFPKQAQQQIESLSSAESGWQPGSSC